MMLQKVGLNLKEASDDIFDDGTGSILFSNNNEDIFTWVESETYTVLN